MAYNIKQQLPYVLMGTLITLAYQYTVNGQQFVWWQVVLALPITALAFWVCSFVMPKEESFSIEMCLKKYGFYMIMVPAVGILMEYWKHQTISIIDSLLIFVTCVVSIILMERSLYD
jgi:peptidoglycan/LPS O-acetylase OafA/YrhL